MTTTRQLLDHLDAWNVADLLPIYRLYLAEYDAAPAVDVGSELHRRLLLEARER